LEGGIEPVAEAEQGIHGHRRIPCLPHHCGLCRRLLLDSKGAGLTIAYNSIFAYLRLPEVIIFQQRSDKKLGASR
jgi:hypothetical protein